LVDDTFAQALNENLRACNLPAPSPQVVDKPA
jgi:hypothetical protein